VKFGLKESTIEKISGVFAKYPEVEKVIVYGSRAKGNFKSGSDIDLTMGGARLTHQLLLKLMGELDDLLLPYKIDLSILDNIGNPDLVDHIRRVGVTFYERPKTKGITHEHHPQSQRHRTHH
jgi:predicted nucleotidyltransferase